MTLISTSMNTFTVQIKKLLLFLLQLLTHQNTGTAVNITTFHFMLDDYREVLGLSSLKKLSTDIQMNLEDLLNLQIQYSGSKFPLPLTKLLESASYKKGLVSVEFNIDFATNYLSFRSVIRFPYKLFSCGSKYSPCIFQLYFFLYSHATINKCKSNSNIILLMTALSYAGFTPLNRVQKSHHKQLVLRPFAKAMDEIFGGHWCFRDESKAVVDKNFVNYKNAHQIRVYFTFEGGDAT